MKKYEVILDFTVSMAVTVEANDEDEAKQLAEEIVKETPYYYEVSADSLVSVTVWGAEEIFDFKVGDKVKWIDPAIDDYDESERDEQLNQEWTIESIDDECIKSNTTILIKSPYSTAEVWADELEHIN